MAHALCYGNDDNGNLESLEKVKELKRSGYTEGGSAEAWAMERMKHFPTGPIVVCDIKTRTFWHMRHVQDDRYWRLYYLKKSLKSRDLCKRCQIK
jgi:hypothetical protein